MKKLNIWDKKFNNTIMEKRIFNIENKFETREDGQEVVVGYGSIFNSRSENLGGFFEYISPTAISEETIEKSDVRALINHDPNLVLARSTAGNLSLSVDEKGLRYEFEIPETSYGKDLSINMKNGNINQSSFAFTVGSDEWSTDEDGYDIRTITSIDKLYDVSPVTYPAYSQAESDLVVAQRGLVMYKEKQEIKDEENDLVARSLAKLKIELIKRTK
jgi:HK97 family phage prohead protease